MLYTFLRTTPKPLRVPCGLSTSFHYLSIGETQWFSREILSSDLISVVSLQIHEVRIQRQGVDVIFKHLNDSSGQLDWEI